MGLLLPVCALAGTEAKIVHGLETHLFPSVGMLVTTDGSLCSGTLIGCQTFLTAAHCVCTIPGVAALDGAQCNASPAQLDPARFLVFFQHAGSFRVAGVTVNPGYIPDTASDLALLRLTSPVEEIHLYAKAGGTAGPASFDCKSEVPAAPGGYPLQFCEVAAPAPGSWSFLAQAGNGPGGPVQVTLTLFAGATIASCVPDAATLCIDDQPGDGRFKVQVSYRTAQGGGLSGSGTAVPLASLGVDRGGLFWFFSPDNPEMLFKILDGCAVNGRFWVFSSAGTNVGLTTTVTDTQTGNVKTYSNPDLIPAPPVEDTSALPCG